MINDALNGRQIERDYKAPRIQENQGILSWNKDNYK